MNPPLSLGQTVRSVRVAANLTGKDVQRLAGIHPTCLSFIELDKREPTLDQLRSLGRAARVDPLQAFGRAALSLEGRENGGARAVRRRTRRASGKPSKSANHRRTERHHTATVSTAPSRREEPRRAG